MDRTEVMLGYVERYYRESRFYTMQNYAKGEEFNQIHAFINDLPNQFNPQTATWGLRFWEELYDVESYGNIEERRSHVLAKMAAFEVITPISLERLVRRIFSLDVSVTRNVAPYTFELKFDYPDKSIDLIAIRKLLEDYKEAHMAYNLRGNYLSKFYIDIKFLSSVQFVSEFYPRKNWPFLRYDGTAFYNGVYQYNGYRILFATDLYPVKLILRVEKKIVPVYKINLTIGYHLTRYDGTYRYDGTRKYDSAIIYEDLEESNMPEAKITNIGREKLCRAHAGDRSLPPLKYIAYGDGGMDSEGIPFVPTGEEVALRNELLRIEIAQHNYPVTTTCEYKSDLDKKDLANIYISELGIFDEEGDLIVYKTFLEKGKDDDMLFYFLVQEIF